MVDPADNFIPVRNHDHDRHLPRSFFRLVACRILATHDATHRDHDGCRTADSTFKSSNTDIY